MNSTYDVIVVGAGHAGIEAALACARRGLETAVFTLSLDAVGNMPCNPSIGGSGKGHLVYELDALGGEMGYAADCVTMQSRTLNTGKGEAVRSKRIQADRAAYHLLMKHTLETQPHLTLVQAQVTALLTDEGNGRPVIRGALTRPGGEVYARAVIISTGTYLGGLCHIGDIHTPSGPDGMLPAVGLCDSLLSLGVEMMRFKTGTPPRILRSSVDFDALEVHPGEENPLPFSVRTDAAELAARPSVPCHIAYTNLKTHGVIRANLHRSPLYSGEIHGTGPRYCPSIEDKVVRFADKERHQLFVEPMGNQTEEIYLQGFSSSLPDDVQYEMLHTIAGFEHAQIMRFAYAIEYDCVNPLELSHTLEFRRIGGLYGAGQFNGSSGYEEAAVQGLIAGINAAAKILGEEPVVLRRHTSYIGTLIDDLVTKGTREPYRIMTSRSEYRLLLRQDNADERLTPVGRRAGLISDERWERFNEKQERIRAEVGRLNRTTVAPSAKLSEILTASGTADITTGVKAAELVRRPELSYDAIAAVDTDRPELTREEKLSVQATIKYEGYIKKQLAAAERMEKLEDRALPPDIDYDSISGLRIEAREKLKRHMPQNLGQASRISGVNPADISVLLIWLKSRGA